MLSLLDSGSIQPKLRVSQPGDAEELEADRIAGQVMSSNLATAVCPRRLFHGITSSATVHRKCACAGGAKCSKCEEEVENARAIHRKAASSAHDSVSAPEHALTGLGSGRALDPPLRKAMEARFRQDLSTVRVHDDSVAAESAKSSMPWRSHPAVTSISVRAAISELQTYGLRSPTILTSILSRLPWRNI